MLVVTSTYLYTVIFIFHLPYIDVYLNLPISKIIHISVRTPECADVRRSSLFVEVSRVLCCVPLCRRSDYTVK